MIYRLGEHTSFAQGAMAEPVACALHGLDLCNIHPGSTVAIIGGGQIGLTMVQLAKIAGASSIILVEPVEQKRRIGETLGATLLIDPTQTDAKQAIAQAGIRRVEVVIECVGMAKTMQQALDLCGKKSICMMFGLCAPDESIPLRPFDIFLKEIEIKASYINPYTMQRALDLIDAKKIDVSFMFCPPLPLERLQDALSDYELRKQGKLIIDPTL